MRPVLIVSPHLSPDTTAGTHRKRRFDVPFMLDHEDPYTWVLAGLAVVLSDTEGQRSLAVAQAAAWRAAVRRWHWEHPAERGALLAAVEEALR